MKNLWFILLGGLVVHAPARADLYLETGLEGGGDTLVYSTTNDRVTAGGGLKLAVGMQAWLDEAGSSSMRFSLGYLWDRVSGSNGHAEMNTVTFDAVYLINSGPHSFGLGAVWHGNPHYSATINGQATTADFQDAFGPVIQYGYHFSPGLEVGLRFSDLRYTPGAAAGQTLDASSVGLYLSNGF